MSFKLIVVVWLLGIIPVARYAYRNLRKGWDYTDVIMSGVLWPWVVLFGVLDRVILPAIRWVVTYRNTPNTRRS